MLQICELHGNETVVVYDDRQCPFCDRIEVLERNNFDLNSQVSQLENELEDMTNERDELREELARSRDEIARLQERK
jgi:predicted  nucleic acid-binding Zn-ribbon protein